MLAVINVCGLVKSKKDDIISFKHFQHEKHTELYHTMQCATAAARIVLILILVVLEKKSAVFVTPSNLPNFYKISGIMGNSLSTNEEWMQKLITQLSPR